MTDGFTIRNLSQKFDFGGKTVSENLEKELAYLLENTKEKEKVLNEIKTKFCFISKDFDVEMKKEQNNTFQLPDGQTISLGKELFKSTEFLFDSTFMNLPKSNSIQQKLYENVSKLNVDMRKIYYQNIVVSGGNGCIKGFLDRLKQEVTYLTPHDWLIKVHSDKSSNTNWYGGSIISSLSTFEPSWMTKEKYEEFGSNCVHFQIWS